MRYFYVTKWEKNISFLKMRKLQIQKTPFTKRDLTNQRVCKVARSDWISWTMVNWWSLQIIGNKSERLVDALAVKTSLTDSLTDNLKSRDASASKNYQCLKGIVYKSDLQMPCEGIMRRRMIIHLLPIMSGTWSDCRNTRVFSSKLHHLEVILKNAEMLPTG